MTEKWFAVVFRTLAFVPWRLNHAEAKDHMHALADVMRQPRYENARILLETACQEAAQACDYVAVWQRFLPYDMTRGRCDWLGLHRATLACATSHRCIPVLLPLLRTGGHTVVWRRRDEAYSGTAPIVLARLAVCSDDTSKRLWERFDASALMVRRIR